MLLRVEILAPVVMMAGGLPQGQGKGETSQVLPAAGQWWDPLPAVRAVQSIRMLP